MPGPSGASTEAAETRDYQITYKEFKQALQMLSGRCPLDVLQTIGPIIWPMSQMFEERGMDDWD
jgi:hypothetical protein